MRLLDITKRHVANKIMLIDFVETTPVRGRAGPDQRPLTWPLWSELVRFVTVSLGTRRVERTDVVALPVSI